MFSMAYAAFRADPPLVHVLHEQRRPQEKNAMKKLILAASIVLFSASAFAANTSVPQQTAMDTSTQQKHTYTVMS